MLAAGLAVFKVLGAVGRAFFLGLARFLFGFAEFSLPLSLNVILLFPPLGQKNALANTMMNEMKISMNNVS